MTRLIPMRRLIPIIAIAALALGGCRSLGSKQTAVISTQAIETGLAAAQDTERAICFVTPATESGPHCTNPIALQVHLSDDAHRAFARSLSKAFDAQKKLATVLKAWRAGDPPPATLNELLAVANQAMGVASTVLDGTQSAALLADVQKVLDAATALQQLIGGSR